MKIGARTSRGARWAVLIILAVVSAGCGGVTALLGDGQPSGGYDDNFYYDHDPYSHYDGYSYYDDGCYGDGYYRDSYYDGGGYYDDGYYSDGFYDGGSYGEATYFVDYVDGWYYDSFYDCYYCKTIDNLDTASLEKPLGWDVRWGSWEGFVRARLDSLRAKGERGTSNTEALPDP